MRIISKFHDYYDTVSHQFLDKDIIYLRDQQEIEVSEKQIKIYPHVDDSYHQRNNLRIYGSIIGVVGQLYPVISIINIGIIPAQKPENFYTADKLIEYLIKNKIRLLDRKWKRYGSNFQLGYLEDCLEFLKMKERERYFNLSKQFIESQTPCFVYQVEDRNYKIIINPCLKDYDFMKVQDPYSIYQNLYMYVSGVLNQPVGPIVAVSDKTKIEKHGFDKFSFRKQKET